jgi:hypothetical protein
MCDPPSCGYPSLDLRIRADINMSDDALRGTSVHGQEVQSYLSRMYTFRHTGFGTAGRGTRKGTAESAWTASGQEEQRDSEWSYGC